MMINGIKKSVIKKVGFECAVIYAALSGSGTLDELEYEFNWIAVRQLKAALDRLEKARLIEVIKRPTDDWVIFLTYG